MSKVNLQAFIQNSTLSDEDKNMWQKATEDFGDDDCQELLAMFEGEGIDLAWLTENIKTKKNALASGDSNLMKNILAEEKEKLSQVS